MRLLLLLASSLALDIPKEHIPFHLHQRADLRKQCSQDPECPYKAYLEGPECWGYEKDCPFEKSYSADKIHCTGKTHKWCTLDLGHSPVFLMRWDLNRHSVKYADNSKPRAQTHQDQVETMWTQGDFGFLKQRLDDMTHICTSKSEEGTELWCSDHLRYCYARNMFFDFKSLKAASSTNKEDVIHEGEVGGHCDKFKPEVLKSRADHKSPLQSWAAELLPFESKEDFQMDKAHCDIIYDKPTMVFKLDAAVSMFHHFCDFVNLYASQHLNGSFDKDINIVLWDTSAYGFSDSMFGIAWDAFTSNPLIQLHSLEGKKVCFRSLMMPLLARQRFGFYYNMPVIDVCSGTGFFTAFSHHLLHRLGVEQTGPLDKVRVTILSRSTKYRRMLNEDQLVNAVKTLRNVEVQRIDYSHRMPFIDQLRHTLNTDVFVGIHGSGLTHLLFLPDWAGVFETYNCGDPNCYWDLARLRGVQYRTWEKANKVTPEDEGHHPTLGAHQKFTNYHLDVAEFVRIVEELVGGVEADPRFQAARKARGRDEL